MIVLIRTVLSFTIEVEIDGVAPWRKALTTGSASARPGNARGRTPAARGGVLGLR